jgi:hypothetical protein
VLLLWQTYIDELIPPIVSPDPEVTAQAVLSLLLREELAAEGTDLCSVLLTIRKEPHFIYYICVCVCVYACLSAHFFVFF